MSYLICGCFCAHACRPAYICMFVCGSALWRSMSEKPNRVPISTCKWASGLASNICVQWKVNGPPVYTFLTISHDVTMNPLWTDLCQKTFRSLPLLRFSFSTFPYCTHQAASLQSEFFWWNHIFSFFFSFASFPSCPPSNSLSLSPFRFLIHARSVPGSLALIESAHVKRTAKSTRMFWLRRTLF